MSVWMQRFQRSRRLTGELVACSFFINLLALASSVFVINVLNRYVSHGVTATLVSLALGTLLAIAFEWAFRDVRRRLALAWAEKEDSTLSTRVFSALTEIRLSTLSRIPAGLQSETLRGLDAIHTAFSPQNVAAVMDFPFAILFVFAIGLLSPMLALITALVIGVGVTLAWWTQRHAEEPQKQFSRMLAERSGLIASSIRDADTVRAFGGGSVVQGQWQRVAEQTQGLRALLARLRDSNQARISTLQGILTVLVISFGAVDVVAGELSVGALIGANILAARALSPLMRVAQLGETFTAAEQAQGRIHEFLSLPSESVEGTSLRDYRGSIAFEDVALAYQGQKSPLFESLSVVLAPGEKLAVVGPNGAGKTSLARLIIGLLEPVRGQIRIDGVDLRQVNLGWWRRQLVYLPQEPGFLPTTLLDNLRAANPEATEAQINAVLRDAGLRSWLDGTPDGLQTKLSDSQSLAVGIRRRIALARALLTQGRLVVADEPTEGLDKEGRSLVLQALDALHKQGRTLIVVSHDPEFLQGANYLLDLGHKPVAKLQRVADQGAVV